MLWGSSTPVSANMAAPTVAAVMATGNHEGGEKGVAGLAGAAAGRCR
jgi:hypothetical protein